MLWTRLQRHSLTLAAVHCWPLHPSLQLRADVPLPPQGVLQEVPVRAAAGWVAWVGQAVCAGDGRHWPAVRLPDQLGCMLAALLLTMPPRPAALPFPWACS